MADQRQKIIDSVFSKRNATGNVEESYVAHVKIWEDAETGGQKPRYILLSQTKNGGGFIHKSKLNTNGTFSVGKTWKLAELRAIHVVNALAFNITLARTYRWQTENQSDQSSFLVALVKTFRTITNGAPLRLEGLSFPEASEYDESSIQPSKSFSGRRLDSGTRALQTSRNRMPLAAGENLYPTHKPPPPLSIPGPERSLSPPRSPITFQAPSDNSPSFNSLRPSPSPSATRADSNHSPTLTVRSKLSTTDTSREGEKLDSGTENINATSRRDHNTRVSFYDPANQTALNRLLTGAQNAQPDVDGEDENSLATMLSVEEMIEGYEWASESVIGKKSRGAAELIEAQLLDELTALEKANIHSFLESDARIATVLKFMDEAISELDNMDSLVSSYKIHLNSVNEDISYIQSQNRGLQVQTQNQKSLLNELETLLQTVNVEEDALISLSQESLEKPKSITRLEEAAIQLYKALLAGRDTDMAATMARLQEYRTHNAQFCKRLLDFLTIMFTAQATLLMGKTNGIIPASGRHRPSIIRHTELETYLGRYAGLMLYLKEMDESIYAKICAAYFSAASELHNTQIKTLLSSYLGFVNKALEDGHELNFNAPQSAGLTRSTTGIRRAGTMIRSPIENRHKDKDKPHDGDLRASEAFSLVLEPLAQAIYQEEEFIADFLHINEAGLTYADYMNLDSYYRRQAVRAGGLSPATTKLVRGAMDLIFGFVPAELKLWMDHALTKDEMEIIGVIASLEKFLADAEERGNQFLLNLLGKQHTRLKTVFDRHVNEQIQAIEQTKLSSKRRQGVAHFIKHFPVYVGRVENQLIGADGLEIRTNVDAAYEKIVHAIFESLKQMAKMDGEEEDKGQLNYHVLLIENMHHFIAETSQADIASVASFSKQAETIYDENLNAYVKIVIRRPFAKIIDYFEGVERLLKTISPNDIVNQSLYNKSALRKVVRDYNAKELRKHVESLFSRVTKHFSEASDKAMTEDSSGIVPGTVVVGVWKACEEEVLRITELFLKRISQCYGDTGVSLEYTAADVEAAFRRHHS